MSILFNHSFKSIGEIKEGESRIVFIDSIIKETSDLDAKLFTDRGQDEAESILDAQAIIHCLKRCKSYLNGDQTLLEIDYYIYYNYAAIKAQEADAILQSELTT